MKYFLTCFCLLTTLAAATQGRYTVSGYVRDSASRESITGATVSVSGTSLAVATNAFGYYALALDSGRYTLTVTHTAYFSAADTLLLTSNQSLDFSLPSKAAALNEVVVFSRRKDANIRTAQMGRVELSINQIKNVPAFLGEVDPLKTIQLLPGVRNAGEGNAGFYVRGGGPDQNLILLDDAVVYNTGHLFGFFSVFNADAIKNVTLIKGGMPAQYGGRLSSVLEVAMKEGNSREYSTEGGIGAIASRVSVQGPIQKDRSSFMLSGRRTYIDALAKPFINKQSDFYGSGYYFYDLNAKMNFRLTEKDRLFFSGYFGRDVFSFNNAKRSFRANIPWGNATATVRWNHVFTPRLFANTTLVYNDYHFTFGAAQNDFEIALSSGIRDGSAKIDFDYYPAPRHKVRFGALSTYHKFIPNVVSGRQDSVEFKPANEDIKYALETGVYVQDDWDLSDKLKLNAGLRWSRFSQIGPYTRFTRDANGNVLDSTIYQSFQQVAAYNGLEPRATLRYALNATTSVKAAVTRTLQFIHLVSNSGTTLPTDLWVPSTYRVQPQESWQYAAGLFKNWKGNAVETSVEVYYKDMRHQIEYKEGYTPSLSDPEQEFVFGKGWSYGAEFLVNKTAGRFTGWIGYTLSWTWRQFGALNGGERFPAKYDRRHDLSVVGMYELSPRWRFGSVFVYGTGNATSLPERFYFVDGVLTQEFSKVNQYRLAPYHRLDLSATYTPAKNAYRKLKSSWVFSIYNVYSRLNPYFVYFDQSGGVLNGGVKVEARQVSLFPILPSVTWNFKW